MTSADTEPASDDSVAHPPKVSVVVATYCPGEGLDRVLASLDRQSMPQTEFESIFVDDGSPDDTRARLDALARGRPNMRVTAIPPSGWPSRPRNIGLQLSRGDYVVFMDHDDELYSSALADAWEYAHRHRLDALTAKEVKTSSKFFSWGALLADVAPPAPRTPQLLSPMTPHKMYRREFLLEHDIRFPEGGPDGGRVQWEDIHFNIDVFAHSQRLGVLASRPFYHWVTGTGSNNSASFVRDPDEFWSHLAAIFDHIDAAPMDQHDADWIRRGNYSLRVLSWILGPGGLKRDERFYARSLELAADFAQDRVPVRIDEQLEPAARARSALLRDGPRELLRPLAECDRGVTARPVATTVRMVDGKVHVGSTVRWTDASGGPLQLSRASGRLTRVLPDDIATALPAELLDLTAALAKTRGALALSGRDTMVGWPVESSHENRLVELADDRVALETVVTAVIDPRVAALGHALEPDRWRVACRSTFAGFVSQPFVPYAGATFVALVDGRVVVAHASSSGILLLDVGGDVGSVLAATRPDVAAATVRRRGVGYRLVVPLDGGSCVEVIDLPMRFRLREIDGAGKVDGGGRLLSDESGARIELVLPHTHRLKRGRYRLLVDAPGDKWGKRRGWITEIVVRVGRGGRLARVSVAHEPPTTRRRRLWC